ncbi:MAG: bifunctional diguanylate cyclase/phosphodiesterase [Pseudomonadales bacterium]|nr:bifunctional diguanylate cyclase/phosphodiesterase [Pseudomonadales bacterium]MCP5173105.1 bifunctional diguanylate cyclase/phosphodiesterase [Pseudomonadales bacterium]
MSSKEELYKLLVDKAPYGTLFFAYGVCIDSNPRALSILDCQQNQLVGASLDEITGNESTALVDLKLQLKKAVRDGKTELNWQCPVDRGDRTSIDLTVIYASADAKEMIVTLQPQGQPLEMSASESNQLQPPVRGASSGMTVNLAPDEPLSVTPSPDSPATAGKTLTDDIPSFINVPEDTKKKSEYPELDAEFGTAQNGLATADEIFAPGSFTDETMADMALSELASPSETLEIVTSHDRMEAELNPPILTEEVSAQSSSERQNSPNVETSPARDYHFDSLTELPSRQKLLETIGDYLSAGSSGEICGAALMVDLDNFKDINDSWGHSVGDQVIKKVGRAISALVTGRNILARMSGDEFVLFIPDISDSISQAAWDAQDIAERVREVVAAPVFLDGHEVILTASIGIALISDSKLSAERVLQFADTAMYEAKRKGRNSIAFFDPCITEKAQRQIGMNTRLRKAIDNQEFALYIQPQICIETGELRGGEALLRWINSDKITNMPAEFIPVLESSGLIIDVGHWVIRTACEYIRSFIDDGIWKDHMRLGINISPRQFRDPQLLEVVDHSLKSYNIDPRYLNFEITENLVIDDVDEAIHKMELIKKLGSTFSIDDFGIGYSSMIYLKRLPFDQLKIDREFIRNIYRDQESRGMVEAIMAVSRQYGLSVTAEGVENKEALDVLRRVGCDAYQGAHFSMPVPVDRFRRMLAA